MGINVLVTGANGQLGKSIAHLSEKYSEYSFFYTDIDDTDLLEDKAVDTLFQKCKPNVVINCAAYTAVDMAESEPEKVMLVNNIMPAKLSLQCLKLNALFIHISTDYVFDGLAHKPYREDSLTNPVSIYGHSKLEGEVNILLNTNKALIIRTSWLYSEYGKNFVKTILTKAKSEKELKVVSDQIGSPTYAGDLAMMILDIIPKALKTKKSEVINYANAGVASWFDFAKEIVEISKSNTQVIEISSNMFKTAAKRPYYSVLCKNKIQELYNITIPYWKDSLKICISNLNKR